MLIETLTGHARALLMICAVAAAMETLARDERGALAGIFTDGDLRRTLDQEIDIREARIEQVMTPRCKTVRRGVLAAEALKVMEDSKISGLCVVDESGLPVGALNMHDLLRAGVV